MPVLYLRVMEAWFFIRLCLVCGQCTFSSPSCFTRTLRPPFLCCWCKWLNAASAHTVDVLTQFFACCRVDICLAALPQESRHKGPVQLPFKQRMLVMAAALVSVVAISCRQTNDVWACFCAGTIAVRVIRNAFHLSRYASADWNCVNVTVLTCDNHVDKPRSSQCWDFALVTLHH